MSLSIIVAMDNQGVIGREGKLPWHLSEDLKRFKQITMGHPIVMGRKTFESIGKPLPGRENIVLTRDPNYHPDGVTVVHSFDEVAQRTTHNEIFIIGGSDIFKLALPHASKIYITRIDDEFEGDVFFPLVDLKKDFEVIEETGLLVSEKSGLSYQFVTFKRRSFRD